MKDKIEEILLRNNNWKADEDEVEIFGVEFSRETMDKVIKELSTLIQEEIKLDRKKIWGDICSNNHITADEFYEHYIKESEVK